MLLNYNYFEPFVILDNLCQDLSLGEKYTATGVYDPFEKIYNIWNIKTTNN